MIELLALLFYLGVLALIVGCFAYLFATRGRSGAGWAGDGEPAVPPRVSAESAEPHQSIPVLITRERPDTPDAIGLITELETHLASRYPSESRHGFSIEKLLTEDVAFFVLRTGGAPAGCGGIH